MKFFNMYRLAVIVCLYLTIAEATAQIRQNETPKIGKLAYVYMNGNESNYDALDYNIANKLRDMNIDVKVYSNKGIIKPYGNQNKDLTEEQIDLIRLSGVDFVLFHVSEKSGQDLLNIVERNVVDLGNTLRYVKNNSWNSDFSIVDLRSKDSKIIKLLINSTPYTTSDIGNRSNILNFTDLVAEFIKQQNEKIKFIHNQKEKEKHFAISRGDSLEKLIKFTRQNFDAQSSLKKPSLMVLPNKINQSKYKNGEYQLTKTEKMLIASIKNKFEDFSYITYGFESVLKRIMENRQINDSVKNDVKSNILELSGIDFFVEFENLDESSSDCNKVFEFKIRNYSTGEDVASDIRNLNSCGNADEYKNFAAAVLNQGAIKKINDQFSSIVSNGRKIIIIFTIANSSKVRFNFEYNGKKLGTHINECLQKLAFKGNVELEEETDLRKQALLNIPLVDETSGQRYQTTTFTEEVLNYLKSNTGLECDRVVSRQVINIKIK